MMCLFTYIEKEAIKKKKKYIYKELSLCVHHACFFIHSSIERKSAPYVMSGFITHNFKEERHEHLCVA